jgi:hypothetical protein
MGKGIKIRGKAPQVSARPGSEIPRQQTVKKDVGKHACIRVKVGKKQLLGFFYQGMVVGKIIDAPVQQEAGLNVAGVFFPVVTFYKIPAEIPQHHAGVVSRKEDMRQVVQD